MGSTRITIPRTPVKTELSKQKRRRARYWNRAYEDAGLVYGALYGNDPSYLAKRAVFEKWFEKGQRILEIGGGYGRNGLFFDENGIKVVSVDISAVATELGKDENEKLGGAVRFIKADAFEYMLRLSLRIYRLRTLEKSADALKFDGIFCNFCLHLTDFCESRIIIDHGRSILKPNGRMIFSLLSEEDPDFGKGEEIDVRTFEKDGKKQLFFRKSDVEGLFEGMNDIKGQNMEIEHLEHVWELETINSAVRNTPFWVVVARKQGGSDEDSTY